MPIDEVVSPEDYLDITLRTTKSVNTYDHIKSFKHSLEIYKSQLDDVSYLNYQSQIELIEQKYFKA